ncbi:MAG TPA: DoxX family membrane protein [Patescibacteria group bacterium]|nr:DoxX family membrane protein [Patescibacteria group bacterium]
MAAKNATKNLSKHVAILRIIFGLMWLINALFKWQPAFKEGFLDQIKSAADGQPSWLHGWFNFWIQLFSHNPHAFAILIALVETLIALALIFGVARRATYLSAAVFSLLIWAVAEGFGGPYSAASTDIGTGIIYAVVFLSLYGLERQAGQSSWSLDNYIVKQIPWWAVIANP